MFFCHVISWLLCESIATARPWQKRRAVEQYRLVTRCLAFDTATMSSIEAGASRYARSGDRTRRLVDRSRAEIVDRCGEYVSIDVKRSQRRHRSNPASRHARRSCRAEQFRERRADGNGTFVAHVGEPPDQRAASASPPHSARLTSRKRRSPISPAPPKDRDPRGNGQRHRLTGQSARVERGDRRGARRTRRRRLPVSLRRKLKSSPPRLSARPSRFRTG
jgi:hypothetical protein